MDNITIPPAALEAAEDAYHSTPEIGSKAIEAAILAALEAWPGMSEEWREHVTFTSQYGERRLYAVLPLPQEPSE